MSFYFPHSSLIREHDRVVAFGWKFDPVSPSSDQADGTYFRDNQAELYAVMFKDSIRKYIHSNNCSMRIWDYCADRIEKIHNVNPHNMFQMYWNTPIVATHGAQGYISNIYQFGWYDCCYFQEEGWVEFPFQKQQLGHVLGSVKNEGNKTTQAVLKINGRVVPCWTIRRLTTEVLHSHS